jgi:HlyD family secretion protein
VETVTASGNIRARRTVEMSSDVSARVAELLIDEGDDVRQGQTLLRLDPEQYQAAAARSRASLAQAQAQRAQQEANLIRAQRDLDRLLSLRTRDSLLVSRQQIDDTRTTLAVAQATLESAEHGVSQAEAALVEAEDQLSKTIFTAPMAGRVTRLNVEVGETVIIGTMNNAGSLVLTISDLSVMEVVVQVDETDVSLIALGDSVDPHRCLSEPHLRGPRDRDRQLGHHAAQPAVGGPAGRHRLRGGADARADRCAAQTRPVRDGGDRSRDQ